MTPRSAGGNRYVEVRRTFLWFSNFLRALEVESEEASRCCSSTSDFGGELIFLLFQDGGHRGHLCMSKDEMILKT